MWKNGASNAGPEAGSCLGTIPFFNLSAITLKVCLQIILSMILPKKEHFSLPEKEKSSS